eukprot:scaffold276865_cov33-Tisochrysis_lutea.AAC.2
MKYDDTAIHNATAHLLPTFSTSYAHSESKTHENDTDIAAVWRVELEDVAARHSSPSRSSLAMRRHAQGTIAGEGLMDDERLLHGGGRGAHSSTSPLILSEAKYGSRPISGECERTSTTARSSTSSPGTGCSASELASHRVLLPFRLRGERGEKGRREANCCREGLSGVPSATLPSVCCFDEPRFEAEESCCKAKSFLVSARAFVSTRTISEADILVIEACKSRFSRCNPSIVRENWEICWFLECTSPLACFSLRCVLRWQKWPSATMNARHASVGRSVANPVSQSGYSVCSASRSSCWRHTRGVCWLKDFMTVGRAWPSLPTAASTRTSPHGDRQLSPSKRTPLASRSWIRLSPVVPKGERSGWLSPNTCPTSCAAAPSKSKHSQHGKNIVA